MLLDDGLVAAAIQKLNLMQDLRTENVDMVHDFLTTKLHVEATRAQFVHRVVRLLRKICHSSDLVVIPGSPDNDELCRLELEHLSLDYKRFFGSEDGDVQK